MFVTLLGQTTSKLLEINPYIHYCNFFIKYFILFSCVLKKPNILKKKKKPYYNNILIKNSSTLKKVKIIIKNEFFITA